VIDITLSSTNEAPQPGTTRRTALAGAGAAIVASGGVLGACTRPSGPTLQARPASPVPITYWKSLSGPRHDAQVALVNRFNDAQERVRVSLEHVGEYNTAYERLRIALASGSPPDTMMLGTNADMPAFARLGVLEPLDDLARADGTFNLNELDAGFVRDSRVGGALFQLPFARSVPLLFTNLDLLAEAGQPETLPTTWQVFLEAAQRFVRTRRLPGTDDQVAAAAGALRTPAQSATALAAPMAFGAGTSYWEFQSTLWSFGGAFSDTRRAVKADTPESISAFQFLADLVHRHRVALATKAAQTVFTQGQLAFLITSSANLTQIEEAAPFRVGAGAVPAAATVGVPGGGAGLSLLQPVSRAHREAGWQFLTFMTSAESTAYFARTTGYSPVRPAAHEEPALRAFLASHPNARVALAQSDRVKPVDAILAAPFANRRIEEALEAILFAGTPVAETCATLAAALRRAAAEG
jgi:sn-glycerol 3-phosphate transport system substrate-binding protein